MLIQNDSFNKDYLQLKNKGIYKIKNKLPSDFLKNFVSKNSNRHYTLKLLNRWEFFRGCNKIFDAGCGNGNFMKLNPFNLKITGIDSNKKMINVLKKQKLNVKFSDLNKKLNIEDNSFDGIACFNVLEHLENPSLTIREFYRILKKGGRLFLIVPNLSFKNFHNDYTHKFLFTKISLYNILRDNGFNNIKIKNGPILESQIINSILLPFPNFRLKTEFFIGGVFPSEFFAFAYK